jgi:hypothetical protein
MFILIYRHPWANKWKGPLTAYFGHDAARGLQVYDCAVGLDTGAIPSYDPSFLFNLLHRWLLSAYHSI